RQVRICCELDGGVLPPLLPFETPAARECDILSAAKRGRISRLPGLPALPSTSKERQSAAGNGQSSLSLHRTAAGRADYAGAAGQRISPEPVSSPTHVQGRAWDYAEGVREFVPHAGVSPEIESWAFSDARHARSRIQLDQPFVC